MGAGGIGPSAGIGPWSVEALHVGCVVVIPAGQEAEQEVAGLIDLVGEHLAAFGPADAGVSDVVAEADFSIDLDEIGEAEGELVVDQSGIEVFEVG